MQGRRRTRVLIGAVAAAAFAALAAGGIWLATADAQRSVEATGDPPARTEDSAEPDQPADSDTTAPGPSGTPNSPETAGGSEGTGPLTDTAATEVISAAVAVPLTEHEDDASLEQAADGLATGVYLAELEAQWQELMANGWSIEGAPKIVSTEVEQASADSREIFVRSCIDSSNVETLDAEGAPIGRTDSRAARAEHVFKLALGDDGTWRVAAHSFPDNPAC